MDIIEHLEELSMLKFSNEEREQFKQEFDKILGFVSEIEKIDISDGDIDSKGTTIQEFRNDEPQKSIDREYALKNAPCAKDGCYVCPLVID